MIAALRAPVFAVIFAFLISSGLLYFCGESVWILFDALKSSLFTQFGLGYTLFYSTPLLFTGLAVAVCFQCGLFNIGAEGQLYMGSLGIIILAHFLPNLSPWVAIPASVGVAALFGGLWASIPGTLKAAKGTHEVITTILLNFIAYDIVDYLVLYPLRNPEGQSAESFVVNPSYQIPTLALFPSTPVNYSLFWALGMAVVTYLFLFRTSWGYELRAVGKSPRAAKFAGISVAKSTVLAMALAGALAGFVGVNEVMGSQHRLIQGFSPGYGFTGIAVALLARSHPLGIILSALLFGALHNSARELEFLSEKVSKELAMVLQAFIVSFVACDHWVEKWLKGRKRG